MFSFLIATAILFGLNAILVQPITKMILLRKLAKPAYAHLALMAPEAAQAEVGRVATTTFILVHVTVMFTAGMLAGMAGCPLIGISRNLKAWPGMLALIFASFYFAHLARA
jgi:hypothetical protein